MKNNKFLRHIAGYIIGILIFVFLIPIIIMEIARYTEAWQSIQITLTYSLRLWISVPIFCIGLFFGIWSNVELYFIGKGGPTDGFNIAISPRTERLVVVGPYQYTRHPMAFGAFLVYLSISIFLNSVICTVLVLVCVFLMRVYLKNTEEKRLLKDFGNVYLEYKRRVPMIIPLPRKKVKYYVQNTA